MVVSQEAEDGLKLVLTGLGEEPLARLRQLLSLRPTDRIDYNLFAGMAALLERQLYSQFVCVTFWHLNYRFTKLGLHYLSDIRELLYAY